MMTKNKTAAKKTEDQSVVYKVPAAFVLMIVVIYAFWKLGGYYSTVEGFTALYPMFCVQRYVFLALTAAELAGVALSHIGKSHKLQQLRHARLYESLIFLLNFQTVSYVIINSHEREERVALENKAYAAFAGRQVVYILAVDENIAAVLLFQTCEHSQDSGLAAAAGAEQTYQPAFFDAEAYVIRSLEIAESFVYIF